MSERKRFEIGLISNELYQAISEVADSEGVSMAQLVRRTLADKFLVHEPEQEFTDNIRVFALSAAQLKKLGIPIRGQVVDDDGLGNRVEFYGEAA